MLIGRNFAPLLPLTSNLGSASSPFFHHLGPLGQNLHVVNWQELARILSHPRRWQLGAIFQAVTL
jgi:hypothetical protein